MQQSKWQLLLGFGLIGTMLIALYYVVSSLARVVGALDQPLIVAILAAAATVLTSTITVVVGRIFERKKEIEAHFRQRKYDQYDELLKLLYEQFDQQVQATSSGDDTSKRLREWQRKLILFAGPKAISAFVVWMTNLKSGNPTVQTVFLMEDFFKALRSDLGVSNRGIERGLFANLILRHTDVMLAAAKNNPNISLAELARIEEELGLNKPYEVPAAKPESGSPALSKTQD